MKVDILANNQTITDNVFENKTKKITGQKLQDTLLGVTQNISTAVNANDDNTTALTGRVSKNESDITANKADADAELALKQNKSDAVGKKTEEGGEIFNNYSNTASQPKSHAEGDYTIASGKTSHAEGFGTEAKGENSHAEGYVTLSEGFASHAEGQSTKAGGQAHAEGLSTNASGKSSHAEGNGTTANGNASHAEGSSSNLVSEETLAKDNDGIIADWTASKFSLAKGTASHVEGQDCLALGENSHTEGYECEAIGTTAHAEGLASQAIGNYSHAENVSTAEGGSSHSEGFSTSALGNNSHSQNRHTIAFNLASTAMGVFNKPQEGSKTSYVASNNLLEIGNGTSDDTRGNAFTVTGQGNVRADGTYESPAGDYAEMFEWADGNVEKEDRVGFIVAIKGEKIVKANGNDHIGIVSAKPSILGDNPMRWAKKYATDEWGRTILEDVEVKYTETEEIPSEERDAMVEAEYNARMAEAEPIAEEELTEEEIAKAKEMQKKQIRMEADSAVPRTREVEKTRIDTIQKLNPDYNPELDFIPRTERSEWSAVGMMGKLLVRQDGTLKEGSRCSAKDGIATANPTGSIYVMEVISKTQALVLVK